MVKRSQKEMLEVAAKDEEKRLVEGCAKKKPEAQKKLYETYSKKMFGVCLRYCNNYDSAQDVMQEAWVNVFKHIHRFRFTGSLEGWIKRIMINKALEHYRSNLNHMKNMSIDQATFIEQKDWTVENISREELLKLVQGLAPGYRTVFNMYIIEGYSHAEIGEMLGISESTSKSQLSRARVLLQEEIKKLGGR